MFPLFSHHFPSKKTFQLFGQEPQKSFVTAAVAHGVPAKIITSMPPLGSMGHGAPCSQRLK